MRNWKEADLFAWLKENYYPDLQEAKRKMSRWDCYDVPSKNRIELKCRRTHYETLLIERKKYDAMIKKCADHNDIPVYINSTPEGVWAFNLSKLDLQWEVNFKNPKTTDFSNNGKVRKEVAYISTKLGIKIK